MIYIPHGSSDDVYNKLSIICSTKVAHVAAKFDSLIILGDLNLSNLDWVTVDNELLPFGGNQTSDVVIDSIQSLGLKQINDFVNNSNNILDLVFIPMEIQGTVSQCDDLGGSSSIYHIPLHIQLFFENCINNVDYNLNTSFNFKKGDYRALNEFLGNTNWDQFRSNNLNTSLAHFYELLNVGIEKFIPRSPVNLSVREPWFNRRLSNLKNQKAKAHKKYRNNPSAENFTMFSTLRSQFKILNRFLYNSYIVEIESNIRNNPKYFWSYVDSKRNCKGFPSQMCLNSVTTSEPQEISEMFASFFESVYMSDSTDIDSFQFSKNLNSQIEFSVDEVLHALLQINENMSCGPDNIHPLVIKECAYIVAQPLTYFFNLSLASGVFPDIWKSSFIRPIFKSGRRSDIKNYRGISILSAIPKLFESLVKTRIFFLAKNCISPNQHGFYPGRSTVTNLTVFSNFLTTTLEKGNNVEVVFTDFSKAFDRIDHILLVQKLEQLECILPLKWILSYLTKRTQKVTVNNCVSRNINVLSGVPQGSHLGPLLFILFIDDVKLCFKHCEFLIYADDIKIYNTITNDEDRSHLQQELNVFSDWCISNKLSLNISKCKIMNFSRRRNAIFNEIFLNGTLIDRVNTFLDLGILFSRNLNFNDHIVKCVNKANSMLGFLIRFAKDFHDPYTLKILFVSLVRSHLEYASIVWNPYYIKFSERIESIQKRFLIFALRRLPRDENVARYVLPSYLGRCLLLNIEPLSIRRQISSVLFVRDILVGRIECSHLLSLFSIRVPSRSLRSRGFLIYLDFHWSNYGMADPVFNSCRVFNKVSSVFDFNLSRDLFKGHVKAYLLNN